MAADVECTMLVKAKSTLEPTRAVLYVDEAASQQ
jgi:hypothetical protein